MRRLLAFTVLAAACGSKAPPATTPQNTGTTTTGSAATAPAPIAKATQAWIDRLGDPRDAERAITELEQLGDPAAIPALGAAWVEQGRPVRILQVIIALARPLTPVEAKAAFMVDYEAAGRRASWNEALPFLRRALLEVDEANPRSVDSATKAAQALGEAQRGLDALTSIVMRPVTKRLIVSQISALRALGAFATDRPQAAAALILIVAREAPPHPRTATTREDAHRLEERYGLYLATTGAAINALAELRVGAAAKPLVAALYRTPELFMQVRRALVASGPAAKDELRTVLTGKNVEITKLFADRKLDVYCGDHGDAPCQPVSARDFYAAAVLGDFHDPATVPELLEVLKRPAAPVYFLDDAPSPNTQHTAVFDALRKIGAPEAAGIQTLWAPRTKADLTTRILAVSASPFVARDTKGVGDLGTIAADNTADDTLRQEAALAFARLSTDVQDISLLNSLAGKYLDASMKKAKEAAIKRPAALAADKELATVRATTDRAQQDLADALDDRARRGADIPRLTTAASKAAEALQAAKKKHRDRTWPFKQLDTVATAYRGYARMFQTHVARIEIATRCKADVACYAASLTSTVDDAARNNARFLSDLAAWTQDERRGLVAAAIDRAMLELGKQGAKASSVTEALLDASTSEDREVRQAILLALPKIAALPCPTCVIKLDAAIRAGEGKTTLGDLILETQVVRNYFAWAGVPSTK